MGIELTNVLGQDGVSTLQSSFSFLISSVTREEQKSCLEHVSPWRDANGAMAYRPPYSIARALKIKRNGFYRASFA